MRFVRPFVLASLSLGAFACTALLGDFVAGGGGTGIDGGGEAGNVEGGVITITPDQGKMGVFRTLTFKASEDVTWSLQEPEAGAIDDKGVLLSGSKPGTFHVVATSKAGPPRSASVPIIVVNLAIAPLAGPNGGPGNIDGTVHVAHFNAPQGVAGAYDNAANTNRYFIADTYNDTIRMFEERAGKVTTIAGKSGVPGTANGIGDIARFTQPGQLAYDSPNKKLYVSDNKGTCIRAIDLTTYQVSTLAGTCGVQGSFQRIDSMALVGDGHSALYVCDNSAMRRIDLTGGVLNVLPVNEYCDKVTVGRGNPTGTVWYAYGQGVVKRFSEPTTFPVSGANLVPVTTIPNTTSITSMLFSNNSLFFGSDQSVFFQVQDAYGTNVPFPSTPMLGVLNDRRVIDGTDPTKIRLGRPGKLATYDGYGLIFPDQEAHAIRRIQSPGFQATTDTVVGAAYVADLVDGPRQTARLTGPYSVATDENGIVYFGDIAFDNVTNNSTIRKYDRTAAVVTSVAGIPTKPFDPAALPVDGPKDQARFWFPLDMCYAKGKLYVLDTAAQAVRSVDVVTGTVATLAGGLGLPPDNVDGVGAAARFKFSAYPSGSGTGFITLLSGAITTDGTNLYVSDSLNYEIRKIVIATGETTTIAGGVQGNLNGTGKSAQFQNPVGLTYDNGFLYIADYSDSTIRRMNLATGVVDGFIGLSGQAGDVDGDASMATVNGPYRLMADGIGNLYLTELRIAIDLNLTFSGVIRRISIKDRKISSFAGATGLTGLQPGPIPSTVNFPASLAITPEHDLIFGDFAEATLAVIQPL